MVGEHDGEGKSERGTMRRGETRTARSKGATRESKVSRTKPPIHPDAIATAVVRVHGPRVDMRVSIP